MLVSVYIPTKNRLQSLKNAVESVVCQTHPCHEIIVVDDGSTDGTPDYLAALQKQEPKLIVISNPTSVGGAESRNMAIRAATSDFITGLDDDDAFTPDRISSFLTTWKELAATGINPSCLYSQVKEIRNGVEFKTPRRPKKTTYSSLFLKNTIGNQIFAPRQTYLDAGLFNKQLAAWQDLEFFIRVLEKFGPAYLVDKETYQYDNSRREDRISLKKEADIRSAFNQIKAIHCKNEPRKTQQLFHQLFVPFYNIHPNKDDYRFMLKNGFWLPGLVRLFRSNLRQIKYRIVRQKF